MNNEPAACKPYAIEAGFDNGDGTYSIHIKRLPLYEKTHKDHTPKFLYAHPSQEWISVNDRLPDDGQTVAFVVKDRSDSYLNGMVLGGKYIGGAMPCFSVPGMGCMASHWKPLPPPPRG